MWIPVLYILTHVQINSVSCCHGLLTLTRLDGVTTMTLSISGVAVDHMMASQDHTSHYLPSGPCR